MSTFIKAKLKKSNKCKNDKYRVVEYKEIQEIFLKKFNYVKSWKKEYLGIVDILTFLNLNI